LGSLAELETQLIIAEGIEYVTPNGLDALLSPLDRIRKMIKGLSKGIA
jgi:four helix bundle protein